MNSYRKFAPSHKPSSSSFVVDNVDVVVLPSDGCAVHDYAGPTTVVVSSLLAIVLTVLGVLDRNNTYTLTAQTWSILTFLFSCALWCAAGAWAALTYVYSRNLLEDAQVARFNRTRVLNGFASVYFLVVALSYVIIMSEFVFIWSYTFYNPSASVDGGFAQDAPPNWLALRKLVALGYLYGALVVSSVGTGGYFLLAMNNPRPAQKMIE